MPWFHWLVRQVRSAALVPIPDSGPESPAPVFFGRRTSTDDCEAFLAGRLAEYRTTHNQYVAASDWMNLLGHGTEAELMHVVAAAPADRSSNRRDPGNRAWQDARRYLAATLLHRVEDEAALRELQRLVLVPLELDMASLVACRTPREWVATVEAALTRHQPSGRQVKNHQRRPPADSPSDS